MTPFDMKRLTILRETRDYLKEMLRKLHENFPEDEVPEGYEREGFIDYPSFLKMIKERKDETKKSLEDIEASISDFEENL